uniref:INCENP_ARK-bind domain-containing protein n=1 Tax=Steinernema glaseri TaxID=37863 RepID=A0A1I8A217_9BILA
MCIKKKKRVKKMEKSSPSSVSPVPAVSVPRRSRRTKEPLSDPLKSKRTKEPLSDPLKSKRTKEQLSDPLRSKESLKPRKEDQEATDLASFLTDFEKQAPMQQDTSNSTTAGWESNDYYDPEKDTLYGVGTRMPDFDLDLSARRVFTSS